MKAILVIDVPDGDLNKYYFNVEYGIKGVIRYSAEDFAYPYVLNVKPKPMLKKKILRDFVEIIGCDFNLQTRVMDYINGYNKCIDEILRKEE